MTLRYCHPCIPASCIHTLLLSLLSLQVASVDRELDNLAKEKEENTRRLNMKRDHHMATLQRLGRLHDSSHYPGVRGWMRAERLTPYFRDSCRKVFTSFLCVQFLQAVHTPAMSRRRRRRHCSCYYRHRHPGQVPPQPLGL